MKSIKVKKNSVVALIEAPINPDCMFATLEVAANINELAKIKRQLSLLKESEAKLSNQIKLLMGDASEMIGPDGTVIATYRTSSGRWSVDIDKLKAKYPAIYSELAAKGNDIRSLVLK